MKLPQVQYSDGISKTKQVKFYGLQHRLGARDGEIWDMCNMSSQHFPLLSTRPPRIKLDTIENPNGMFGWGGLAWVSGTKFYHAGVERGTVTDGPKTFAGIGSYIIILPDKAFYNIDTREFGSLESTWSGGPVTFDNGTLYGEPAMCNTIRCTGVTWSNYFREGDAIEITGCLTIPANNKSAIIREISGDKLSFYENIFTLAGDEGTTPYTETGTQIFKRTVPDMFAMFENENRLWGISKDTIYASKLGDIFNWNVYDGLDTDSYAVDTGTASEFIGCAAYQSYPTFFKEDHLYKVYGEKPSNFQVMGSATLGLAYGSAQSWAISGEMMFYLARTGFVAYTGGIPQPISDPFGVMKLKNGVAGSDGLKYYCSAQDNESGLYRLYVYDTQNGVWHIEDDTRILSFAYDNGDLYMLDEDGAIWMEGNLQNPPYGATYEPPFDWYVEFSDFTGDDPNKKTTTQLQIRIELDDGAEAQVWIKYDGGNWEKAYRKISGTAAKQSFQLPVIPHRCDYYRIKITGNGGARIYSIARDQHSGSEMKSTQRGW